MSRSVAVIKSKPINLTVVSDLEVCEAATPSGYDAIILSPILCIERITISLSVYAFVVALDSPELVIDFVSYSLAVLGNHFKSPS